MKVKKINKPLIYIIFFFIALLLCLVFFGGLRGDQFFYLGDQLLRFNYFDSSSIIFSLRRWENLGVHNSWQFTVQLWDALFFMLFYSFGFSVQIGERLLFLLILFLSLSLSFKGFSKWLDYLGHKNKFVTAFAVSIWYCFNPYVVMLWHGGVYSLGAALTYSIAPLLLLLFYKSLFIETNYKSLIRVSLLMATSFVVFWLFAPLIFAFVIFFIGGVIFYWKKRNIVILRSLCLLFMVLPLILPLFFGITHELFNNSGDMNALFTPTFSNQDGGLLYMFLFLFSWGIYNVWYPRSIYSFHQFYYSQQYLWGIIIMYVGIVTGIFWYCYRFVISQRKLGFSQKDKEQILLIILFIFIYLISLFFAKGIQEPYGGIFMYLYEHIPLFSVFRTPDIRFGFTIVLSLSLLIVVISRYIQTYLLVTVILILVYLQSSIFFSGQVIKGDDIPGKFYDRIIGKPKTYQEVADYINSRNQQLSYVMTYPSVEYSDYLLDGDHHIGQDILPHMIEKPFVYMSESNGISQNTYFSLKTILDNEEYNRFNVFPIEYFIIRRDTICATCKDIDREKLSRDFSLVLENKDFSVYRSNNFPPVITGSKIISYEVINPTTYRVTIDPSLESQEVHLRQNYQDNWHLYVASDSLLSRIGSKLLLFNPLFEVFISELVPKSHKLFDGYANSWTIKNSDIVNYSNSGNNLDLYIIYKPQIWYNFLLFISFLTIISYIAILSNVFYYIIFWMKVFRKKN